MHRLAQVQAKLGEFFDKRHDAMKINAVNATHKAQVVEEFTEKGWKAPPKASGQDTLMPRLTLPEVGSSAPLIMRIRVDLPDPLRPMMPTFSPLATCRLTLFKTIRGPTRV